MPRMRREVEDEGQAADPVPTVFAGFGEVNSTTGGNAMTTENVAAAMPRLERLRRHVGTGVCLSVDVWMHNPGTVEVKWDVWDGAQHFYGPTIHDALTAAEAHNDLGSKGATLELVVLPVCGDSR